MSGAGSSSGTVKLKIVNSARGGEILLRAGHQYYKQKNNKDSSWWRCVNRKDGCSASVTLNSNRSHVLRENAHCSSCIPNFEKNEVKVAIEKCKQSICEDLKPIPATYRICTKKLKDNGYEIIKELPNFDKVKSSLYRHRNRQLGITKSQYTNATEIVVPDRFKDNLLFDEIDGENRMIVFASQSAIAHLNDVRHYFADGTFKCCAKPFLQLYVVHGDIGSTETETNIVPFFYAVLTNKEETTYERLFSKLKFHLPEWTAEIITLDFEKAPINAIKKTFPKIIVKGCFVHFGRALLRKAKSLGLLQHEESHNHVKLCMALAHLPREDINDGWLYVMSQR